MQSSTLKPRCTQCASSRAAPLRARRMRVVRAASASAATGAENHQPEPNEQRRRQQQQQQAGSQRRRELLLSAAAAAAAGVVLPGGLGLGAGAAAAAGDAAGAAGGALPLVPKAQLTPRLAVSKVIKGCWQLSGGHKGDKATDRTAGREAVADFRPFYDAGITSFDMADHYGPAEALAGKFLASDPALRPGCQVLSKYCVFSPLEMASVSGAAVRKAIDTSRKRLGVERVDMMQFYWGSYEVPRYVDAALYLMDLRAEGVIGEVGVTNFDVPRLEAMNKAGVEIASNQVQYSLLDRRPTVAMAGYCAANGIAMLPYGVLGGGFLSDKYLGADVGDVRADTYSKGKYGAVIVESLGGWQGLQRLLGELRPIADKHSTSIANVAARWVLQQPGVPAIIIGARNASHVADHRALFAFELDSNDLAAAAGALAGGKQPAGDCYAWERGGGF
ncbi:MAG: NADP-dependent oxidoreductase domain-containing protein [Monoraphidium minutum]|nr:MAG: NADP-dependent oxidoreductase domain-containing protein [Monoraphidium minutum]